MPTVSDLTSQFRRTFEPERQRKTIDTYRQGLKTFIRAVGDNAELNEDTYILFLTKTKNKKAGTQATYRAAVSGLYDFAESLHIIPPVNLKRITKRYGKKRGKRLIKPDMDEIRKALTYANTLTGDLIALRDRAFIIAL